MNEIQRLCGLGNFPTAIFPEETVEGLLGKPRPVEKLKKRRSVLPPMQMVRHVAHSSAQPCPFDASNTSSPEFLKKLERMLQSGKRLPRAEGCLRVALLNPHGFLGETAAAARLLEAFAKRGQECCICEGDAQELVPRIRPTFALSLWPAIPPPAGVPSALVLARPYANNSKRQQQILRYENILHSTPAENIDKLKKWLPRGRKLRSMPLLLSVSGTEFCAEPKTRLFYGSSNWDQRRGVRYRELFQLLDGTNYFDAYGPADAWVEIVQNSYRGFLPWAGGQLLDAMQKSGISLCLHGDDHLHSGTPSPRVLEGAAASTLIISDRHPFVEKNFGDSVLYVDQEASPEEMFRQIDGHVQWAQSHPEEAEAMARRSHAVFMDKFRLENEVERIEEFFAKLPNRGQPRPGRTATAARIPLAGRV